LPEPLLRAYDPWNHIFTFSDKLWNLSIESQALYTWPPLSQTGTGRPNGHFPHSSHATSPVRSSWLIGADKPWRAKGFK
jgi:hypothetical protein